MREKILFLRSKGKTYDEIVGILGCARSLIAYHSSQEYKKKSFKRNNASRIKRAKRLKEKFGGKCNRCSYSKCLAALDFHYTDPSVKKEGVMSLLRTSSYEQAEKEASKCELVCSNCHREIHDAEEAA